MSHEHDRKSNVSSIESARKARPGASSLICSGVHAAPDCGATHCRKVADAPRYPVGVADTEPPPAPGPCFEGTSDPTCAHFRARYEGCRIALELAIQRRDTSEIAASYASLLMLCDEVIEALEVAQEDRDSAIFCSREDRRALAEVQKELSEERGFHHPGSEPTGHPISECKRRGC